MKRLISLAAVSTLAALSLTACSSTNTVVPNSHVTVAEVGSLTSLNADVTSAASNKIASDVSVLTTQNFYEVDKNGELVANPSFGTVKVVKESPFTVTYSFGKEAVWSDGSKMDSTDLALAVTAAKNAEFNSIHFGTSLSGASIVGTPKAGDSSLTLQFDKPIADWKTVVDVTVPAHVVGKFAEIGGNVAAVRAGGGDGHDRALPLRVQLDEFAAHVVLALGDGHLRHLPGGVDEYLKLRRLSLSAKPEPKTAYPLLSKYVATSVILATLSPGAGTGVLRTFGYPSAGSSML